MCKEKLSDGRTICGAGRLKEQLCDDFQPYCGNTIMNNLGDLQDMVKAVEAILHQSRSTNEAPDYKYCSIRLSSCHFLITSNECPEYVHALGTKVSYMVNSPQMAETSETVNITNYQFTPPYK